MPLRYMIGQQPRRSTFRPAGEVTGFGPLNEGIQSAITEAANVAAGVAVRDVVPALSADLARRINSDVLPALMNNPRFTAIAAPAGRAAGEAAFAKARPFLFAGAAALAIAAGATVFIAVKCGGKK